MSDKTAATNADIAALSFEDALAELEAIVRGLEEGKGDLEDAIGAYERGAALKRHCEQKLKEAKAKVDKISIGPDGAAELESMDLE
jgi:exodeoxyribonuclease VII small subunit